MKNNNLFNGIQAAVNQYQKATQMKSGNDFSGAKPQDLAESKSERVRAIVLVLAILLGIGLYLIWHYDLTSLDNIERLLSRQDIDFESAIPFVVFGIIVFVTILKLLVRSFGRLAQAKMQHHQSQSSNPLANDPMKTAQSTLKTVIQTARSVSPRKTGARLWLIFLIIFFILPMLFSMIAGFLSL